MTKSDLIKALEPYPDDTPILIDMEYDWFEARKVAPLELDKILRGPYFNYPKDKPIPVVIE